MKQSVLVVGPGRVGKCLALIHQSAGDQVRLLGRKFGAWSDWAQLHQIVGLEKWSQVQAPLDLILFCVADQHLPAAVMECQQHDCAAGALVAHCSGAFGAEILHGLHHADSDSNKQPAKAIAAAHPLMAFAANPSADSATLAHSMVTLACLPADQASFRAALSCWQADFVPMAEGANRATYHLALCLLANHTTALCAWALELLQPSLGAQSTQVVRSMSQRAVDSCLGQGAFTALTGPVVRGDVTTVQAHLDSLPADQTARYRGSLLAVIDLAEASGRLQEPQASQMRALAGAAAD